MSDRALMIEKLTKPFPQEAIKSRTIGGNRKADYVDGATVIRRLNEATDCQWDFTVDQYWTEPGTNGSGITFAKVTLTIPGLGSRQHMGVQSYNERSGEDVVAKGAITDALKKAATLFGVALDLYGPDYESGETAAQPERPPRQTQRQPSRQRNAESRPTKPAPQPDDSWQITEDVHKQLASHAKNSGVYMDTLVSHVKSTYGCTIQKLTMGQAREVYQWIDKQVKKELEKVGAQVE